MEQIPQPILLQSLNVFNEKTGEYEPYSVSEYELNRYCEWKFTIEAKRAGTITELEFQQCPSQGINCDEDGFYVFAFSGGCFYVEVSNKQVESISGYGSSEMILFDRIEKEYGEQIQRAYDAQRALYQQGSTIQRRDFTTPEDNQFNSGMVVQ